MVDMAAALAAEDSVVFMEVADLEAEDSAVFTGEAALAVSVAEALADSMATQTAVFEGIPRLTEAHTHWEALRLAEIVSPRATISLFRGEREIWEM